ncbi:MAG TPA: malto-oligosyltrehalose synthase, partial [Bacteroidales bacterium]|nr:malto-oligosyltrehalose synthase [Bacteroidales bacterium]
PLSYLSWHLLLNLLPGTNAGQDLEKVKENFDAASYNDGAEHLVQLYHDDKDVKQTVDDALGRVNGDSELLARLIGEQIFLPVFWKESETRINYRRFFTINDLICLKMEDLPVFDEYHKLIRRLVEENIVDGLRVDHVDGLYDPGQYLRRLRALTGERAYLIVEKILEKNEKLKSGWPVQGNTGYDFATLLNNLFTNVENALHFSDIYDLWDKDRPDFDKLIYEKKHFIIFNRMAGDLDNLVHQWISLPGMPEPLPDRTKMKEAIAEFLIQCPVYKIYPDFDHFDSEETLFIESVFKKAADHKPELKKEIKLLSQVFFYDGRDTERRNTGLNFFLRCMQYTGPLMAKGLEDTAFYSYAHFIAHNEVGDSPDYFGIKTRTFHREMTERLRESPLTLNATSTHDSKRGEDSRARLTIISDIPEIWEQYVFKWREYAKKLRGVKQDMPTLNDEYFIYQSIAGSYPAELVHDEAYKDRLTAYIKKSIREAKDNTSWSEPDKKYEEATIEFTKGLLEDASFMISFREFLRIIVDRGFIYSLAQVLLKNTCPGIPDLYRGSETWNFSFVDPDNRRPVDFVRLEKNLDRIISLFKKTPGEGFNLLWNDRLNGDVKQWLTWLTLNERSRDPDYFRNASYIPLEVKGKYKDHLVAYMRYQHRKWYLVAVPVQFTDLYSDLSTTFSNLNWGSTRIELPELSPDKWENLLTGHSLPGERSIMVDDLLKETPVAFLRSVSMNTDRSAGILLHISSLPGPFGTGNMGKHAYDFVDFLHRNGQTRWQILPLNFVDANSGYSPYSCLSAFAGNILFIDPHNVMELGLVSLDEIGYRPEADDDVADFAFTEGFARFMVSKAFGRFKESEMPVLEAKFNEFCRREAYWLDDFALFLQLKELQEDKPWIEWPGDLRDRSQAALDLHRERYAAKLEEIKFAQFLFYQQWCDLKAYANEKGIKIIGDIPFYVSFDSADVWANPQLFKLDSNKQPLKSAGVPPDYFNDEGQLWNMPVYRWDLMKDNGYTWWKQRLAKNLELFDQVRIDHFRAFSNFWEVPAGEKTAINGEWVDGPGEDILDMIRDEFPGMPFIAEDLGDVDQAVYDLRDKYQLSGMNVLQFAFGDDMDHSVHALHNHKRKSMVYTGTHDNNTLRGWYRHELDRMSVKRMRYYTGIRINSRNCNQELIRLAFMSPGTTVIIPMQDYLGLGEHARMNKPSTVKGNWTWRMEEDDIIPSVERMIQRYTMVYGRLG